MGKEVILWETIRYLGEGYVLQKAKRVRTKKKIRDDGLNKTAYRYKNEEELMVMNDSDNYNDNHAHYALRIMHLSDLVENFREFEDDVLERLGEELVVEGAELSDTV